MRQVKLLGLALMAILSLSIAATSAASALTLEGLPAKLKFSFASTAGEKTQLVTLGGKNILCESVSGSGEFLSMRLGDVEFKFIKCKDDLLGTTCTGLSDTAGNITVKGEFHLRHLLSPNEAFVTLVILVSGVHFSCLGILFTVNGCVASDDVLTEKGGSNAVNVLRSSYFANFLQSGGDAVVTSIDTDTSLTTMEECVLLTKQEGGTAETSGQLGSGTINGFKNEKNETVTALSDLSGTQ